MAAGLDLICGTQQQSTQEKRTGKRKTELDAQTSLLERGIEFLHNHHFCCPLRMTETEWGQNQEDLWALRGSRRFFGYVSWQNLKSVICLPNTHENNHHSAVTNEFLGSLHHIWDLTLPIASLDGRFLKPVSGCLQTCPWEERCLWKRNLTKT